MGGIQAVTLGDDEARRRGTQKTVLERKAPPTFDIVIEIVEMHLLQIHHDVAEAVDNILLGHPVTAEMRQEREDGEIIQRERALPRSEYAPNRVGADEFEALELQPDERRPRIMKLLTVGVSREHVEKAVRDLRLGATVTDDPDAADVVIASDWAFEQGQTPDTAPETLRVRSDTYSQVREALASLMDTATDEAREDFALREAAEAADRVIIDAVPIEPLPQSPYLRRLQRELLTKSRLKTKTVGDEPKRRIRVLPPGDDDEDQTG